MGLTLAAGLTLAKPTASSWKITGAPGTGDDLLYSQAGTPTLDLRFASSKSLNDNVSGQNLIDFTRGGNGVGTYVGSDGLIKNSVVNLLLRSEEFDNASWAKTRVQPFGSGSVANAIAAPDGTLTADKLVEDTTASNNHFIGQSYTSSSGTYTFSCYIKAAERSQVFIGMTDGVSALIGGTFTLTNGTTSTSPGGSWTNVSVSIVPLSGGWYRCIVTATQGAGTAVTARIYLSSSGNTTYTGDGTSGLYLWGAQLEASTTPGEYVKTTSSISGAPRFDHDPTTGESLGLLIEESRINLLLRSEEFNDAAWNNKVNGTVTSNAGTAPNGLTVADRFIPNAMTGLPFIAQTATVSSGTTYTWSVYLKADGYSWVFLDAFDGTNHRTWFDLSTGTVGTVETGNTSTITSVGNGWYRCTLSRSAGTTSIPYAVSVVSGNNALNITANGTSGILLYGAQLEAGAFPTSYIPTTSATVTRNADVAQITGSNFSRWYSQSQGTVFADAIPKSGGGLFGVDDTTSAERIRLGHTGTSAGQFVVVDNNSVQTSLFTAANSAPLNSASKFAGAYQLNDFDTYANGGVATTSDTSGTLPTPTQATIGTAQASASINGTIRRLAYFDRRLPNAVLQAITS
jgi:hypothetical protein